MSDFENNIMPGSPVWRSVVAEAEEGGIRVPSPLDSDAFELLQKAVQAARNFRQAVETDKAPNARDDYDNALRAIAHRQD